MSSGTWLAIAADSTPGSARARLASTDTTRACA